MTPERLQEIRDANFQAHYRARTTGDVAKQREHLSKVADYIWPLLDYIDLLHEDLRITRQERDHAKHQALEHRKARARLEYDLLARDEKDTE